MASGFALFDTPAGTCGVAWQATALAGIQLPAADLAAMRASLVQRFPGAVEQTPPPYVQQVVDAIVAALRGEPVDLSCFPLDLSAVRPFDRRVLEETRRIPPGRTVTYGELASTLGTPRLARAVGGALGRNPFPIVIPCHRVLAANGKPGGFSAPGGLDTKRQLLAIEGVRLEQPATPAAMLWEP